MNLLEPTVIANQVAADCCIATAEREARARARLWGEAYGTGVECVPLQDGKVLVVTHAYDPTCGPHGGYL